MPANTTDIEKRLWDAADDLRANSKLKSSEYSIPVLGLIFLRYADYRVKCEAVYQHVYDSYYGAGGSVYGVAG